MDIVVALLHSLEGFAVVEYDLLGFGLAIDVVQLLPDELVECLPILLGLGTRYLDLPISDLLFGGEPLIQLFDLFPGLLSECFNNLLSQNFINLVDNLLLGFLRLLLLFVGLLRLG